MRRAVPMLVTTVLVIGACSSGSDDAADTTVASPDTVATTSEVTTPPTEAPTTTQPATTGAPATTIDEAALLADAEAAYLEAFEVALETIRDPDNPDNESQLREHFTDGNLEVALENLRRAVQGGFVARENPDNPSFVVVVEGAELVNDSPPQAELTVCEFNSDRIYELGTAPDGGDSLVRDDPVSLLFVTRLEMIDGRWKSKTGGEADEIRDEVEQCSSV